MKKTIIFSAIIFISGLLIAVGPQLIFKACPAGCCSAYPACFWATKVMIGLGMIITALGIFNIVYNEPKIQLGMFIGILLTGIMVLLNLHVIIGACVIKTMACRLVAYPVLTVLGIITVVCSGINIIFLKKNK